MKIVKDSGAHHWALLQEVECLQCRTVFQAESEDDFRDFHGGTMSYVWMTCPRCEREQKVFKKWSGQYFPFVGGSSPEIVHLPSSTTNQRKGSGDDVDMSIPFK